MTKTPLISDEERELFRNHIKGTQPLKKSTHLLPSPPHFSVKPRLKKSVPPEIIEVCDIGHDQSLPPVQAGDSLHFMRPGLQWRVMQRLKRGEFPVGGELDLHGLTVTQAHEALHRFLNQALEQGWRCVRIIHGKGWRNEPTPPILKNRLNYWLREYDAVLAFCSALPQEGGKGAVRVLLRRRAKEE